MGTLTAGQPRLPGYCDHKLPTSCRLSSIGECCACYDERSHAVSYSTYIDGIGYVLRGTRWQRYCWFCKEFWENRVQAAGLRPSETRIPEVPDLAEFLRRWYEFHQGFRVSRREDGTEERIAVLGEDFKDVSPGCLPRTLEELRAGRERTELEEREQEERERRRLVRSQEDIVDTGPSLDDALNELLAAADAEEGPRPPAVLAPDTRSGGEAHERSTANIQAQAIVPTGSRNPEYQARRVTALRRELQRMRSGIERVISGLRELGESVPDPSEASLQLANLGRTLDVMSGTPSPGAATPNVMPSNDRSLAGVEARVEEARHAVDEATRRRRQAASELEQADGELTSSQARLRQVQHEQRTMENYTRLFGTREEMLAQGENYESPIGGMFTRAWERFRVAEEVRSEERALRSVVQHQSRDDAPDEDVLMRLAEIESRDRDVWGVRRTTSAQQRIGATQDNSNNQSQDGRRFGSPRLTTDLRGAEVGLEDYYSMLRRQGWAQHVSSELFDQIAELDAQDSGYHSTPRDERRIQGPQQGSSSTTSSRAPNHPSDNNTSTPRDSDTRIVAGPPGQSLDEDPYANNDRGLDAVHVLSAVAVNDALRACLPWHPSSRVIMGLLENIQGNEMTWADKENVESILENVDIVWRCGLPSERNARRRRRGEQVTFTPDAATMATAGVVIIHDVEVMAEAFQISAQVRSTSGLSAPQQLHMLYRLQRGERTREDRSVLETMLRQDIIHHLASNVHAEHYRQAEPPSQNPDPLTLESPPPDRTSQSLLATQGPAAQALALAAGRLAMRTNPAELMTRLHTPTTPDDEPPLRRRTRARLRHHALIAADPSNPPSATYRPLTHDDFGAAPLATDSDHEESDDEARGLDSRATGRPEEPLSDESMTVKLDCRICYAQLADTACLPCGHLVMCKWCSEEHSPTLTHDRTRPRRAAACPVCRKAIRQKVRIYRA